MENEDGSENAQVATGQDDTGRVVAGRDGETAQVAAAPTGDTTQAAAGTEPKDEKGPIPYERFEEVNTRAKNAEMRAQQLEQYLYSMQAQRPAPTPQTPQADPVETWMQQNGVGADGYLTPDDFKKFASFMNQQVEQRTQQQQLSQWLGSHPDYNQVVTTPTGQPSEHLMKAFQNDPMLFQRLSQNWDPVIAYHAAKPYADQAKAPVRTPAVNPIPSPRTAPPGISAATGAGVGDMGSMVQGMTDDQLRVWLKQQSRG